MNDNCVLIIAEVINMIARLGATIIGALITGVFILGAAFLAYRGGLRTYFKKREHEQIMKRYLEEGIDRVLEGVAQALRVFLDNHVKANSILTLLRADMKAELPANFSRYERKYLEFTAFYKVEHLVGDTIFVDAIMLLFAFVDANTFFLNSEFSSFDNGIPKAGKDKEQHLERLKINKRLLDETFKESENYYFIHEELQLIASILEGETSLDWAGLSQFKSRPDIRESVKRAKHKFAKLEKAKSKPRTITK